MNDLLDSSVGSAAGDDGFSGIGEFVEVGFDEIVGCMVRDEDEEGVGVVEGVLGDELIIHAQQFSLAVPMPPSYIEPAFKQRSYPSYQEQPSPKESFQPGVLVQGKCEVAGLYVGLGVGVVGDACTMQTQQCSIAVPMEPSYLQASEQRSYPSASYQEQPSPSESFQPGVPPVLLP